MLMIKRRIPSSFVEGCNREEGLYLVEILAVTLVFVFYIAVISFGIFIAFMPELRAVKLRKTLLVAIKNNCVENIYDVYTLFKGINNFSNSTNTDRQEIGKTLRRLNVYLIRKINKSDKEDETSNIRSSLAKVKILLEENDKITPFSELPTHERFVIEDAKAFLENKDWGSVDKKINELANFLIIANERKNKSEKQSKLSIFLAVVSIVLSVLFSFWQI